MARWEPDAEGRLVSAAVDLFDRQGYVETTVADIAGAAGLTKRTFFRHFADKREVLFRGSELLQQTWVDGIREAPRTAGPMDAVLAGLDRVAELFTDRLDFARTRANIVASSSELQERELIKLQRLATAIEAALAARGVDTDTAELTGQAAVTVFHHGFARWLAQDDPAAFREVMRASLHRLRSVTAA